MAYLIACLLAVGLVLPGSARAEERKSDDAWLKELRASGAYRQGRDYVSKVVDQAYDIGAVAGASHWEDVHAYYTRLARSQGCEKGSSSDSGHVRACPRVSSTRPKLTGVAYAEGLRDAEKLALDKRHGELLRRVLALLYDYGYVQGLKHGLLVHNDDIRLTQEYYRACIERARLAAMEPMCAEAAKAWSRTLLAGLNGRIEAHGIPDGDRR